MYCVTVTYPKSEGSSFNYDYYVQNHIPLCAELLAPHGYLGHVLRSNQGEAPGSDELSYASIDLLFESQQQMEAGLAETGESIIADLANYTNVNTQMSFSELTLCTN
jgi:uncharacterized protein (TIGR02118 family)